MLEKRGVPIRAWEKGLPKKNGRGVMDNGNRYLPRCIRCVLGLSEGRAGTAPAPYITGFQRPMEFPSVSWIITTGPTPPIYSFGIMILPASFSTFASTLSMSSTITKLRIGSVMCRLYSPPVFSVPFRAARY
jgi:hypothetical protein